MHKAEDIDYMQQALALARTAATLGEVPVGAVVVFENKVISTGYNEREGQPSALAHAELLALARASQVLQRWRLSGCTLYVTLEPCLMCAGALVQARLDRVVFAAKDPKGGAVVSLYQTLTDPRLNHRLEVSEGILAEESAKLLQEFFRGRRQKD